MRKASILFICCAISVSGQHPELISKAKDKLSQAKTIEIFGASDKNYTQFTAQVLFGSTKIAGNLVFDTKRNFTVVATTNCPSKECQSPVYDATLSTSENVVIYNYTAVVDS